MGNSAYKRQAAIQFNGERLKRLMNEAEVKSDRLANPKNYMPKSDKRALEWAVIAEALAVSSTVGKEEPKLIKNWEELAEVPENDYYLLSIIPEDGNGWIINKKTGDHDEYLSTHTFYGGNVKSYEHSTKLLQKYGFNVTLESWG